MINLLPLEEHYFVKFRKHKNYLIIIFVMALGFILYLCILLFQNIVLYREIENRYNSYTKNPEQIEVAEKVKIFNDESKKLLSKNSEILNFNNLLIYITDSVGSQMRVKKIEFNDQNFSIVGVAIDSNSIDHLKNYLKLHMKGIVLNGKQNNSKTMEGMEFQIQGTYKGTTDKDT